LGSMSIARTWDERAQRSQPAPSTPSRDASLEQRLRDFLRSGGERERSRTSIPGVFVVKLPGRGPRGAELALEINPVDGQGQPRKRRGYMVRGKAELEELSRIISDPRLARLAKALEAVNPRTVRNDSRMIDV
jgi:hypothetical protein